MSPDEDDKPKHKGRVASSRVPDEVFERAQQRAKKGGRSLGQVIRAFLFGYADDEYPEPPSRPDADTRAPQRPEAKPRKPRKRKGQEDDY